MTDYAPGQTTTVRRRITAGMVARFAELSGDKGRHHMAPDAQGRVMAHGLLTATLPTELGGMMNFMAREMKFEFAGAVYAGDTLECVGVVESAVKKPLSWRVSFRFEIKNQRSQVVLRGTSSGVILRDPAAARPSAGAFRGPSALKARRPPDV